MIQSSADKFSIDFKFSINLNFLFLASLISTKRTEGASFLMQGLVWEQTIKTGYTLQSWLAICWKIMDTVQPQKRIWFIWHNMQKIRTTKGKFLNECLPIALIVVKFLYLFWEGNTI